MQGEPSWVGPREKQTRPFNRSNDPKCDLYAAQIAATYKAQFDFFYGVEGAFGQYITNTQRELYTLSATDVDDRSHVILKPYPPARRKSKGALFQTSWKPGSKGNGQLCKAMGYSKYILNSTNLHHEAHIAGIGVSTGPWWTCTS